MQRASGAARGWYPLRSSSARRIFWELWDLRETEEDCTPEKLLEQAKWKKGRSW